jgi:predicted nucleic acid-binding protein
VVPASLEITSSKEELRRGDRLIARPASPWKDLSARAPEQDVEAQIISVYGSAVVNAAQNQVVVIDRAVAHTYGVVRLELKKAGTPIPINDTWIAAIARHRGLPVVSRDAHFDAVSGVERVSW